MRNAILELLAVLHQIGAVIRLIEQMELVAADTHIDGIAAVHNRFIGCQQSDHTIQAVRAHAKGGLNQR